jgi:hypothetical protein
VMMPSPSAVVLRRAALRRKAALPEADVCVESSAPVAV